MTEPDATAPAVTAPEVITETAALRAALAGRTVAFVPTMGALHEGHLALVDRARELADTVVVSIFVNPLQFGEGEDFDRYPRTLEADTAALAQHGVDVVFAPSAAEMYPRGGGGIRVVADASALHFEGASRPGHFDGMLTVVLKLLNIVQPAIAVFGQKDAQQVHLVRRMVADLDLPVEIEVAPTVRDADGLALSSRNRYLSATDRATALALSRALAAAAAAAAAGEGPDAADAAARAVLTVQPGLDLDYFAIVDIHTFESVTDEHVGDARAIVAARVGATRLIDNAALRFGSADDGADE